MMNKQCIIFILWFFAGFKIHPISCERDVSCVCITQNHISHDNANLNTEYSQQVIDWARSSNRENQLRTNRPSQFAENGHLHAAQNYCQKHLARKNLSLADYKQIFSHPSFSPQELHQIALHSFDHYHNPNFQSFLKSIPEFKKFAQELINKEQNKESSPLDDLESLQKHDTLFFCKQTLRNNKRQRMAGETRQKQLREEKEEVKHLYNYYSHLLDHEPLSRSQEERYVRRVNALARILKDNGKKEVRRFKLTHVGKDVLKKSNIELNKFIKLCGNNAQIELHEECISLVEQAAQRDYRLKPFPNIYELNHAALDCANVAVDYNKAHKLDKAYKVADFAWAFADYGYAIVQGIGDGIINVTDQIIHPIKTSKEIVENLGKIGATMAAVLCEVCDIDSWPERAEERSEKICEQITDLYNAVKKKLDETSGRDRVRAASQFATEWYLPTKCLKIVLPICSRGVTQAKNLAKQAPEFARNSFAKLPLAAVAGPDAHICNEAPKRFFAKMENAGQKISNKTQKICPMPSSREKILPKMKSYEQARNKALEIIGDVDSSTGKPHIGKFGVCRNKINGREWGNGRVVMYLDYDPIKGAHLNVKDYRIGKGICGKTVAIPFEGTERSIELLLKHLQ